MILLQQIGWALAALVGVTLVVGLLGMCCAVWHMMYVIVQEIYYKWRANR